jgi:hypothetical protein
MSIDLPDSTYKSAICPTLTSSFSFFFFPSIYQSQNIVLTTQKIGYDTEDSAVATINIIIITQLNKTDYINEDTLSIVSLSNKISVRLFTDAKSEQFDSS